MGLSLSIGVSVSVGLAMIRVVTGISILWFLIPGYAIAFDSGGVASGPMTATFLIPFAMGACEALGGNIITDAFGIVAMVAMTPLITIQLLGFRAVVHKKVRDRIAMKRILSADDEQLIRFM